MNTQTADMLLVGGRFLTMETPDETADAVAIKDGRILYVGNEKEAKEFAVQNTKIINLEGRVACPGLIDCHTHPLGSLAARFVYIDFRGENTASLKKVFELIKERADKTPKGEWIIGRGFDESKFLEGPISINAKMLDEISSEHPIMISRTCGHVAVLNSIAMKLSGFTNTSVPPKTGGHFFKDQEGNLTGMISGSITGLVPYPPLTEQQKEKAMITGVQEEFFKKGITSTGEMGAGDVSFRLLKKWDAEKKLKLRIGYYYPGRRDPSQKPMAERLLDMGFSHGYGSDRLSLLGVKYVMDGSTGGRTAAFSKPYLDNPNNYGELYNDQNLLNQDVMISAKAGFQVSIHAIGDRAIESALESVEYANQNGVDTRNLRFRFEHLESPTKEQIERIKKLNISVGLSSAFIYWLGDSHLDALGFDRTIEAFPAKTLIDNNIIIGCNTDCPVCDVNPMYGIYSMVVRKTQKGQSFGGKEEAINRIEALKSYTKDAAYILCNEENIGTLKVGKHADITIFQQDFLNVSDEELKNIQTYMTISGGEIVYQLKEYDK